LLNHIRYASCRGRFDFYDRLKTVTQGYGSFDYELIETG